MLLQVKALAKAKAKAEAACGDDSCCGCCCCESSSSVSTVSEPTLAVYPDSIPIPVPPSSGCSIGQHKVDGTCVWDTVTVTPYIPDTCPSGFFPNGYGSCLPVEDTAT